MPRKANSNSNAGEKKPEEKKTQDFGELGEFEEAATSTCGWLRWERDADGGCGTSAERRGSYRAF